MSTLTVEVNSEMSPAEPFQDTDERNIKGYAPFSFPEDRYSYIDAFHDLRHRIFYPKREYIEAGYCLMDPSDPRTLKVRKMRVDMANLLHNVVVYLSTHRSDNTKMFKYAVKVCFAVTDDESRIYLFIYAFTEFYC
jgi:hypothetical protein